MLGNRVSPTDRHPPKANTKTPPRGAGSGGAWGVAAGLGPPIVVDGCRYCAGAAVVVVAGAEGRVLRRSLSGM